MKYTMIFLIAVMIFSCSEYNPHKEGDKRIYSLTSGSTTKDSVILLTTYDSDNDLVNIWRYVSYFPNGNVKTEYESQSDVSSFPIQLSNPSLDGNEGWKYLPDLEVLGLVSKGDVKEKKQELRNTGADSTISYPYYLKYNGKEYYSNQLVEDSCLSFSITFKKPNNNKIDYLYKEDLGFVYISYNLDNSRYILELQGITRNLEE